MKRRTLTVLAVIGAGCVVAGLYLRFGLWLALIAGGIAAAATGLLVDDGATSDASGKPTR